MRSIRIILSGLSALALALAGVSLVESDFWFIRILDFIREPMTYGVIILAAISLVALQKWRWPVVGGFVIAAAIGLFRIWPYLPIAAQQVPISKSNKGQNCFSVMALNVKMENTSYSRVTDLLDKRRPDIVFLMETNDKWVQQVEKVLTKYPYRLVNAQDNYYGMTFASKIPVVKARMVANTSSNTPTLYATLRPTTRRDLEFIGLHPRPPIPGQSTRSRDANIARAGLITPDGLSDVIVMGDFNDVPWSRTTRKFAKDGGFFDPRIGRGTFPTFPATATWLGWPLDQFMIKGRLIVEEFNVLEPIGSDHRPIAARLCVDDAT